MENHSIVECLELQLSEVEMLSSMYPKSSEFAVTIPSVIVNFNNYISGKTEHLFDNLDYTLYLEIADVQDHLEVNVNLPHQYPNVLPKVYARSSKLTRMQQRNLNCSISEYLSTQSNNELCVIPLITWLTGSAATHYSLPKLETESLVAEEKVKDNYCIIWIYSHHIYNKEKRRSILETGKDLHLSGFCLPGKPGIICAEGYSKQCDDFYQLVRKMSWKKISLIKKEEVPLETLEIDDLRRFEQFQEISFQVRRGPSREYHMDMGSFFSYLETHKCSDVFQLIFGLEGRPSSHHTQQQS